MNDEERRQQRLNHRCQRALQRGLNKKFESQPKNTRDTYKNPKKQWRVSVYHLLIDIWIAS
jgi:hypothetical protein